MKTLLKTGSFMALMLVNGCDAQQVSPSGDSEHAVELYLVTEDFDSCQAALAPGTFISQDDISVALGYGQGFGAEGECSARIDFLPLYQECRDDLASMDIAQCIPSDDFWIPFQATSAVRAESWLKAGECHGPDLHVYAGLEADGSALPDCDPFDVFECDDQLSAFNGMVYLVAEGAPDALSLGLRAMSTSSGGFQTAFQYQAGLSLKEGLGTLSTGQWYKLGLEVDSASGRVRAWLDDALVADVTSPGPISGDLFRFRVYSDCYPCKFGVGPGTENGSECSTNMPRDSTLYLDELTVVGIGPATDGNP